MNPRSFTIKNGITHFHYKYSELKEWIFLGNRDGNVGILLVSRNGNLLTYKCYGTLENPFTTRQTLSIQHHPVFDGVLPSDEQICNPPEPIFDKQSHSFYIFDTSKL